MGSLRREASGLDVGGIGGVEDGDDCGVIERLGCGRRGREQQRSRQDEQGGTGEGPTHGEPPRGEELTTGSPK